MNSIWEKTSWRIGENRELLERYDKIILVAICHQLGLCDQLEHLHEEQNMSPHFRSVIDSVVAIRRNFQNILQTIQQGRESDKSLVMRRLTNIGILLKLDPALSTYSQANQLTQELFLGHLKQFIYQNDPELLRHILESLPRRLQFISSGFENLNQILRAISDEAFQRLLVLGIARVGSLDNLDRVLAGANMELTPGVVPELTSFVRLVLEKTADFQLLPSLELLFRLLVSCSSLSDLATEAMNVLVPKISDDHVYFMYLVAGIVMETGTIPPSVETLPLRQKLILTLCASNGGSVPENLLLDSVSATFDNKEWTTDEFYLRHILRSLCSQSVTVDAAGQVLRRVFAEVCGAIGQKFETFTTYGEAILGFRKILKSETASSAVLISILTEVQPGDVHGVFVLLSILSLNLACYDVSILIENDDGFRFMSQRKGERICRDVPITAYSRSFRVDTREVVKPAPHDEMCNVCQIPWDHILSFWDACLSMRGRILSRLYLATILKYVRNPQNKLSENRIPILMKEIAQYTDYYNLMEECHLYSLLIGQNPKEHPHFSLLRRGEENRSKGIGFITQNGWEHTLVYNIFERGNAEIQAKFTSDGYIVLHNHRKVVVHVPSWHVFGAGDVKAILVMEDRAAARIQLVPQEKTVIINGTRFAADPNATIEFITKGSGQLVTYVGDSPGVPSSIEENASLQQMAYEGNLLESPTLPLSFPPDLFNLPPVVVHEMTVPEEERDPYQDILCADIQDSLVDMRQPISCSAAVYEHLIEKNEILMSSQLKTSILVEVASQDPNSLSLNDRVLILASCIPALFRNRSFDKESFPMDLGIGLIDSISMNAIMDDTIAAVLHMLRLSLESNDFLNELGQYVVQLARSKELHCMSRKRDMLFVPSGLNPSENATKEGIRIEFSDGSSGIIQQDSWGNWSADTPIVFLTLLWILIDNCKTPEQRINAKLALMDSWIVGSPMIQEVLPEFLMYMQRKMTFTPFDFNKEYIHHLAWAASKFREDYSITCFYSFEKHCFECREMVMAISHAFPGALKVTPCSISINLDKPLKIDNVAESVEPREIQIFRTLMRHYDSFDDFPIWDFLPLWNAIRSLNTYEPDSDTVVVKRNLGELTLSNRSQTDTYLTVGFIPDLGPHEIHESESADPNDPAISHTSERCAIVKCRLRPGETRHFTCPREADLHEDEFKSYRVCQQNLVGISEMIKDAQLFSSWTTEETNRMICGCLDNSRHGLDWILTDSFAVMSLLASFPQDLKEKYGLRVVNCKLACLFIQNGLWKHILNDTGNGEWFAPVLDNPLFSLVQDRLALAEIEIDENDEKITDEREPLFVDLVGAQKFNRGQSKNIQDSMLYQLARGKGQCREADFERFKERLWFVVFKETSDTVFPECTKAALPLGIASFIASNSGLCVTVRDSADPTRCTIIPYPSEERMRNVKETELLYFMFGILLGAVMRTGSYQDIPFPSFIWEMLAGQRLNSEWILKNDRDLALDIEQMRGEYDETHPWSYCDWNGEVKKISGFQTETVKRRQVDVYENAVLRLRMRSLEHWVGIIRNALMVSLKEREWITAGSERTNQHLFLGAFLRFACQGASEIDVQEVVGRIEFRNGEKEQQEVFRSVLLGFDKETMAQFLELVTYSKRLGRNTKIRVEFTEEESLAVSPWSHFIDIPRDLSAEVLREKLICAIQNGVEIASA